MVSMADAQDRGVSLSEFCASFEGQEMCAGGEMLLAAIAIECCFYILVFVGGWELLKAWFRSKNKKVRMENPWK